MRPDSWRVGVFVAGLTVLYAVEALRPARPWKTPHGRRLLFHAGLAFFNTALTRFFIAGPLLFLSLEIRRRGWGAAGLLRLAGAAEIAFSLIALDLFDYWWHRWNHTVAFLWRFHKVHHVDTHVDVTTSLRFHPGELLISGAMKALWILALGPSLLAFALFEALLTLSAQFHHSNIDFSDAADRRLRRLIVTPRFHASHHTVEPLTREANFSSILIVWDKLFGSYRELSPGKFGELGLPKGRQTCLSPMATLLGPFSERY